MKNFLLFIFAISIFGTAQAQKHTISGYVTDAASGEKLISASVYNAKTLEGTVSNEYGFYSLTINGDSVRFVVSYVGYTTQRISFFLHSDTVINVALQSVLLSEVVIESDQSGESIQERTQMSTIEIPVEQIKALPAFLGEVDVLKTLQLLPGVSGGTEGSSGIYVRGGSPDQNLILLDGVPVYNASHLFGFFSVFNADAINKVTLIKGGFPARYGGRLSSVIDIRMKEGNMNEYHGEGSIGLVASRFTFEGPIIKNKASFMISARRTYIDIITRPIIMLMNDGDISGYYFYDLNAKVNYKFSDKDRFYMSGYFGRDKAYFITKYDYYEGPDSESPGTQKDQSGLFWGNATAVARWNHVFDKRLFSNLTATFTDYKFDIYSNSELNYDNGDFTSYGFEYYSGIHDWSLKYDFDFIPTPSHYLKFGAGATLHTFQPGATQFVADNVDFEIPEVNLDAGKVYATEYDVYAEDDWEISPTMKINAGLHGSGFSVNDTFYVSLQPRASFRYLINDDVSFKASFSTMTQYIHLLTNSGIGLPTDLWVPATATVPPQKAWQAAIGGAWSFMDAYEISLETYYKKMHDIIEYKDGASYLYDGFDDWENKVESGEGDAYGLELFIQKNEGRFTGWFGYTLSWSTRIFPTINLGERFPYKYDRRHDFEIACIYKLNDHIDLSGDFVFTSGQPVTLPIAQYPGPYEQIIYAYEGRNGYRMNPYNRLDVNISFHKEKEHFTRTWNFGAYNVYNQRNPFFIYIYYDSDASEQVYRQVSLFPVIPYASWEFKF